MKSRVSGFTLIEMVIVAAIIGILAAIAYPSYQDSVRKSNRADARAVLIEAAQWMERFYTDNLCYSNLRTATGCDGTAVALPASLQVSPRSGVANYNISLTNLAANAYTLNAVPTGGQSNDPCGTLTLTNSGVRNVTGSKPVAECWR